MIKMSCTVGKEIIKEGSDPSPEIVASVSEMVKRALEQHFRFSSKRFDEIQISIKFGNDGRANLVLS